MKWSLTRPTVSSLPLFIVETIPSPLGGGGDHRSAERASDESFYEM